jgi:hypothetical protein
LRSIVEKDFWKEKDTLRGTEGRRPKVPAIQLSDASAPEKVIGCTSNLEISYKFSEITVAGKSVRPVSMSL